MYVCKWYCVRMAPKKEAEAFKRLSVNLPMTEFDALKADADARNETISEYVRAAVKERRAR